MSYKIKTLLNGVDFMRKLANIIILLLIVFSVTGCSLLGPDITTKQNVRVVISDAYCEHNSSRYYMVGQDYLIPYAISSHEYIVEVEYQGKTFILKDEDLYKEYRKCIGEEVMAVLEIDTYSNGRVTYEITKLY